MIILKLKMQKVFGISLQKVFGKVFKCPQINMHLVIYLNTSFWVFDPTLRTHTASWLWNKPYFAQFRSGGVLEKNYFAGGEQCPLKPRLDTGNREGWPPAKSTTGSGKCGELSQKHILSYCEGRRITLLSARRIHEVLFPALHTCPWWCF